MKVLLVQLPVPDNRFSNVPLALGYLKAMADAALIPGLEVELLKAEVQNRAGDALLLDTILAHSPDMVGFSLYTWNSSRVLGLARALKHLAPEILILGGGPEVNRDGDFILASPDFDFLILGEGERTFVELLRAGVKNRKSGGGGQGLENIRGLAIRQPYSSAFQLPPSDSRIAPRPLTPDPRPPTWHFAPSQPPLEDVNLVPSAYLSGALEGHLGRFMAIELSRWCPSKCTFCYYGRQDLPRGGKRYFEVERVRQELLFGLAHGVEQVHFVEANFNTLPHLPLIYDTIQQTGANRRMSFYAELRGEAITQAEAIRLAECNFGTVEVGLQSAIPEVLARVRRKNNLPRLIQGVHHLRGQGIEVFLDVILGLPGETADTLHRTLDFVEQNDLAPYDLFNLQILAGTQLKAEVAAGQHGMRWQLAPPYFVLETADLSFENIRDLRRETLLRKGDDPTAIPGLPAPGPFALTEVGRQGSGVGGEFGPIERVVLDFTENMAIDSRFIKSCAHRLASQVTVWLKLGRAGDAALEEAEVALSGLSEANPSGVWHIFADCERLLSEKEMTRLYAAVHHSEDYLDRAAIFAQASDDKRTARPWASVSLFQILPHEPRFRNAATPETVWRIVLDENQTADSWRWQIAEALKLNGAGLQLITPPDCSAAKMRAALQDLDSGGKAIWLADWGLAAGLAYAAADDSAASSTALDFPLTAYGQAADLVLERPAKAILERAALRWVSGSRALA